MQRHVGFGIAMGLGLLSLVVAGCKGQNDASSEGGAPIQAAEQGEGAGAQGGAAEERSLPDVAADAMERVLEEADAVQQETGEAAGQQIQEESQQGDEEAR